MMACWHADAGPDASVAGPAGGGDDPGEGPAADHQVRPAGTQGGLLNGRSGGTGWYWMILNVTGWYWMVLDDTG